MANALLLIRNKRGTFRGAFKKIADFILENPSAFVGMDIKDVSLGAGVAQSSVVRFYQALNFRTFADFKIDVVQNLAQSTSGDVLVEQEDTCRDILRKTTEYSIQAVRDSMESLDFAAVEQAVQKMLTASDVFFYGIGTSAVLVSDIYYRLMRIGLRAFFATDPHIMRTTANQMTSQSVAFGISYTGRSMDTIRTMEIAKSRGAFTICLTGFRNSPICRVSDLSIICISNEIKFSGEAYANTIAQKNILDGIYNCIAKEIFTDEKKQSLQNLLEEVRYSPHAKG